jgi:N-formylglutamate deformylase
MLRAGMQSPRTIESPDDAAHERLGAEDVGLPPELPLPLRFCAAPAWSPLVISFPHVGLAWPDELGPSPAVDFARNADYAVGHIYEGACELGAATVEAVYSRLLVDLNRASDDISARVVPDHPAPRPRRRPGVVATGRDHDDIDHARPGRGVVWSSALGNVPLLRAPLTFAAFHQRIARFHEPYYLALERLLERRRRRFGYAILLDAHSMPCSVGIDLVLGSLGGSSCGGEIERLALDALAGAPGGPQLRLRLNDPYHGGELVRRFGRPAEGLHALQLEVSRSLYMDERSMALWDPVPPGAPVPTAPQGLHRAHRIPPPTPRHAADFAELRRRVSCLIRALAQRSRDASAVGTSFAAARATDPQAPRSTARVRTP